MDLEGKRVAIYARVSTEMQAEEEIPITGQVEECQSYLIGEDTLRGTQDFSQTGLQCRWQTT